MSGEWDPQKPKIADTWRIENRINRGELKEGDIVRLGGLTDCFQPAELKYRTTLETIKILNKYNIGYLIVTKSHLVANDEYIEVMPKVTPHVCRHTFCSKMAKSGMNPKSLQYIMGHADISVTLNTYTHVKFEDAEEEMKRVMAM